MGDEEMAVAHIGIHCSTPTEPAKGSFALQLGLRGKIGLLVLGLVVCGCVAGLTVPKERIITNGLTATLSVQGKSSGQMPNVSANLSSADDDEEYFVLTAAEAAE